ncbi:MATE family efflux transporter [Clostridium transplantifaecale]|uniref:MATE family efflux transporter n=1 Tax=Clostridium transplantifaecale TaxID=2479838 RepID=UPI000F644722|nr:MATE family efflux transporter [Clostridium transplantifaecale]
MTVERTAADNENRTVFESMPVIKALAVLAVPTIISQLITLVYNLADTYFVGRTGNSYMIAAVALVYPVFSMTAALANLFGVGGGSLISRLLGSEQEEQAEKVCSFSFYSAILISLLFSMTAFIFLNPLLKLLGASSETVVYAREYMFFVVVLGAVPAVLSSTIAHLLRSAGYARLAGIGLSLGAVLNIVLDPLFMFVILPAGQEVTGAALATMLSNLMAAVYFLVVLLRLQTKNGLCIRPGTGLPERENMKMAVLVGLPSALTTLFYDIANVFLNVLMAAHGDYQLAALGIILKAERLPLNTGVGICHGMLPLVAYNYSSGDRKRMFSVINTARTAGLIVSAASILLYEIFSGGIIRLFISTSMENTSDTWQTIAYGTIFLRSRCLAAPFAFMNFHITYTLQAVGDGKNTLMLAVLRQCIIYIPMMFIMNVILGATGLVWTQILAEIITLCIALHVFKKHINLRADLS